MSDLAFFLELLILIVAGGRLLRYFYCEKAWVPFILTAFALFVYLVTMLVFSPD
jgi:hypothetical protein